MLVTAALERWAAEHRDQLSNDTVNEVSAIATRLDDSLLRNRPVDQLGDDFSDQIATIFPEIGRAQRATTLIDVVAAWAQRQPPQPNVAQSEPVQTSAPEPSNTSALTAIDGGSTEPDLSTPTVFRSDRVDEEDHESLYGPRLPVKNMIGGMVALAVLVTAVVVGLYWFSQRNDVADTAVDTADAPAPTASQVDSNGQDPDQADSTTDDQTPGATATDEAAPSPEPTPDESAEIIPGFWADVTPILNPGTAEISASTYTVSAANRAVLTGHTAAITGVIVTNDGRVLTSGADRRLVDWGADATVSDPDVLNVTSPLTVLERTADQHAIAGDSTGTITVIDLVTEEPPQIESIHPAAVSAVAELDNGDLAVASADGPVDIFNLETPSERVLLNHTVEVTAVAPRNDGTLATAAVDGVIRLWNVEGELIADYATLTAPITALITLSDGNLAAATVDGQLQILEGQANDVDPPTAVVFPGHVGAVRALFELQLADGTMALASGGDDTTVRLWDRNTQTLIRVLEGHGDIISGIDMLPDGRLVSTSGDGTGRLWDLSVPETQRVTPPHDWSVSAVHPWNNDQFVTGGIDGKVVLASTAENTEPRMLTQHDAPIVGLSVLDTGDVVSLDSASVLRVTNPVGDAAPAEVALAAGSTALDVRDGQTVLSGHADGTVRLHDLTSPVGSVQAHDDGVTHVVALESGLVASSSQDRTVRIIDFDAGQVVGTFDLHTGPVDVVAELLDGRIVSAGADGIFIYTADGLATDHVRLNGQRSRILSVQGLAGQRMITTGTDGRVRLWDLTTPEEEPVTLLDIPGVVNPHLAQADNGLFVAAAARGYVVFTLS